MSISLYVYIVDSLTPKYWLQALEFTSEQSLSNMCYLHKAGQSSCSSNN